MRWTLCRSLAPTLALVTTAVALRAGAAPSTPCTGDLDNNGSVDFADLTVVLLDWGCANSPGPCPGDVDGRGDVGFQDLTLLLTSWGPCGSDIACDAGTGVCSPAVCTPGCDGTDCCPAVCAAEVGLAFGVETFSREVARFIVTRGEIDGAYGEDLWLGTYDPVDGDVTILPAEGYTGDPTVNSIVGAIRDAHDQIASPAPLPCPADDALPTLDPSGTLCVKPVPLTEDASDGPYYRLTYEWLAPLPRVRITSRGVDGDVSWTIHADYRIGKNIELAIVSPHRVVIGKNVRIEGRVGTRYGDVPGELDQLAPLRMVSDFEWFDAALGSAISTLHGQIAVYDQNGDNRLDVGDPLEAQGLIQRPGLVDADGDGFVDDLDLFIDRFDDDEDGRVIYDAVRAGRGVDEFEGFDDALPTLIDEYRPDRNGDGLVNRADRALGYLDGAIDGADGYAKVHGGLDFAVDRAAWELAQSASYQTVVNGPIRAGVGADPVRFEASETTLPVLTTDMFQTAATWFEAQVPSGAADFESQRDAGVAAGGTYVATGQDVSWEPVPYGAPEAFDFYDRSAFRDIRFENVRIPMGTNGLFERCTFVGVTFIETETNCVDVNWNYTGAVEPVVSPITGDTTYEIKFPDLTSDLGGVPVSDTKLLSNNIRFHDCTFIGSVAGDTPGAFTHWRNAVQFSGATRFYLDEDAPDLLEQPDADPIRAEIAAIDAPTLVELRTSSILLPGWDVRFRNEQVGIAGDVPRTTLVGAVVAGAAYIFGRVELHGTLVTTFRPIADEGPLFYGGAVSDFRTAVGYAWEKGHERTVNGFGAVAVREDPHARLPDGIPWPLHAEPVQ